MSKHKKTHACNFTIGFDLEVSFSVTLPSKYGLVTSQCGNLSRHHCERNLTQTPGYECDFMSQKTIKRCYLCHLELYHVLRICKHTKWGIYVRTLWNLQNSEILFCAQHITLFVSIINIHMKTALCSSNYIMCSFNQIHSLHIFYGCTDILPFCICLHTHTETHTVAVAMVSGITSVSADKRSCETNCANLSTSAQTRSHIKAVER